MSYHYTYNRGLVGFSKTNRKSQTDAEQFLWRYLRNRRLGGYKFRRQYPIFNYILDFYCIEQKVAIELDGSQHKKRKLYDSMRSNRLQKIGVRIIRFWDNEVFKNIDEVLEFVLSEMSKPHPDPLLKGEGK